jgi:hypothetical protein
VFVVGDNGTIYHYTTTWATQTSTTTQDLNGVWGSSSTNVFAVGDGGTVLKYNGATWSAMSSTTSENLNSIWGDSASEVYAVGDSGTILRYNGLWWSTVTYPSGENLNGIWGIDNGTAMHIYAVGDSGTILHSTNGTSWTEIDSPTLSDLNGIWGSKPSNIFVAGDEGTILYYGGIQWIEMDSGILDDLRCPFGIANPHVFIVGLSGYIALLEGPYLYGTICNSCTGTPLIGVTVTYNIGQETEKTFTTTQEVYPAQSIDSGRTSLSFEKANYATAEDTIWLPPNKSYIDQRTYLVPSTYSQYNGCISGVVAKDIYIDVNQPVITKGLKEPRINLKLYKSGGCGAVEVESVFTDQNGYFRFPTITKPGTYTLRMLNPDPQHCKVKIYNPATHELQEQDSFLIGVPQLAPAKFDFKFECEGKGLVDEE